MTRLTPRERAMVALDVIDRHHMAIELRTGVATPKTNPAVDRAYRDLAAALDAIYGPLPNEGLILAHLSDDDRGAKCGTIAGYRWHLDHDSEPCRQCRLAANDDI